MAALRTCIRLVGVGAICIGMGSVCQAEVTADQKTQARKLQVVESTEQQNVETRWAVVIGISNYQLPGHNLQFPAGDAVAMRDTLIQSCGFPEDHIKMLVDGQATAPNIRTALGTWLPRVARPHDLVLIYFSGHGCGDLDPSVAEDGVRKYLLTYEADAKNLYGTAVPMEELATALLRISAERTVVLLDCCYSGGATPHVGGATLPRTIFQPGKPVAGKLKDGFVNALAQTGQGRLIMTACAPNEVAYEYPELKHGMFSYNVMQGLSGKALDGNGTVTASSLYEYVSQELANPKQPFEPQKVTGAASLAGTVFALSGKGVAREQSGGVGTLNLLTSPLDADVIIDNEPAVKSPLKRTLKRGPHHVTVIKKDYEPVDTEVFITSGRTTELPLLLNQQKTTGELLVSAPPGALIKLDDAPKGTIPSNGYLRLENLPSKAYTLSVEAQGFSTAVRATMVTSGKVDVEYVLLAKELAGLRHATPADVIPGLRLDGDRYLWEKDGAEMVFVSEGPFWMGSDHADESRPRHEVTLPAFWIDRCEVTNAQFERFINAAGYHPLGGWKPVGEDRKNRPAVQVTLEDARAYARWAGKIIPSEAQWEKACRGTDDRLYPYGSEFNPRLQNLRAFGFKDTLDVGTLSKEGASPYGAMDMLGNVMEWCDSPYIKYPGNDAAVPNVNQGAYVIRGGSFQSLRDNLSAATRFFLRPNMGQSDVGFRCALPPK